MSFRAHLSHVSLAVPDPEATAEWYERVVGLVRQEVVDDRLRLGWGVGHHALELIQGDGSLDHFAFEVPDRNELAALADRVGQSGSWQDGAGDHPRALVVNDPDGHRAEFHERVDRSGERAADAGRRPVRVQHVTLGSPRRAELVEFYVGVVGFRISDHMGDVFTWLRSDDEHHSLAIVSAAEPGLDHYSYDVNCWNDFKTWCDALAAQRVQVAWGPGRHGPGNNLFIIFPDLDGVRVELSAEMERYWDDRSSQEPRRWEPRAETVNLWGPTPSWRDVER